MIEGIYCDEFWIDKALKYFGNELFLCSSIYNIRAGAWQFANKAWGWELCAATMLEF